MTRGAPWGHETPERRAERAQSHWCEAVAAGVYAPVTQCPYCGDDDPDGGDGR